MGQDKNVKHMKRAEGALGDFGAESPRNSFSGGETDHLFLNHRGTQFYDLDELSGLAADGDGRTFCTLDYDRDGWTDFVTASANAPTFQLFRNRLGERYHPDAAGARVVALRFVGGNKEAAPSGEWSNRNGYGAFVTVDVGEAPLVREVRCGEGRAAQNSATMLVGIGEAPTVASIRIEWPSGRMNRAEDVPVGSLVTFFEDAGDGPDGEPIAVEPYLRRVLDGAAPPPAPRALLPLTLPARSAGSATAPRLHLVTAMTTHCLNCARLQPQIGALRAGFAPDEVGIWGVGTDLAESAEALAAYGASHTVHYDVLADLSLAEREAVKRFVIDTLGDDVTPVTIVIDAEGHVIKTIPGVPSVSAVRRLLAD